jgi:two-component system, sensor histidine kinase and response regulator
MNDIAHLSSHVPLILIVDDNPQNLQVLGKQLKEKNYDLEFAINGSAALEWINNRQFDLILLDINMPGISGFEVCQKIRSRPEMNNIPIIFLSADTDRESILKGFELGAQDYITKPFDNRELIVRVRTHLALKDTLEKLAQLNKSLEEKVLERTRQLKEANEKLEATNLRLVGLDKAKSEFLNLISHEIRTPLNGILGPMELLKGPVYASEIGNLIDMVDSSVKRLEKFSLDALLITRLKTKEGDIKKERISLSELTGDVLNTFNDKIKNKNLNIIRRFDPKADLLFGEKELIFKSISNILDNSVFFSPMKSDLTIITYLSENSVVCEFTDQGPGFTPDLKNNVSELFTHSDKYRDDSKGIGLPIVKMIMEAHGGDLILENNPEGGAKVKLLFVNNQEN